MFSFQSHWVRPNGSDPLGGWRRGPKDQTPFEVGGAVIMKKILVPLADGFEEIETVTVIDVLRRAGLEVVVAGIKAGELLGSRRVKLVPDTTLEAVQGQDFDMVVVPGGQPGVDNLRRDPRVLEILKKMNVQKKWIGAICAAPLVLQDAGLAKGRKLTSHPSVAASLAGTHYSEDRVVVEDALVTSRGPGTAIEFALKLVEILAGKEKVEELKRAMWV